MPNGFATKLRNCVLCHRLQHARFETVDILRLTVLAVPGNLQTTAFGLETVLVTNRLQMFFHRGRAEFLNFPTRNTHQMATLLPILHALVN